MSVLQLLMSWAHDLRQMAIAPIIDTDMSYGQGSVSTEGRAEMDFVLVRHGVQDPKQKDGPLTPHGRHQARALADGLKLRGTTPGLILTSKRARALETAKTLQQKLRPQSAPAAQLIEIDALTPKAGPGDIAEISRQAGHSGADLTMSRCVLLVGHEGRLSDLVTELTGHRAHPLPPGGAVCVRGASFQELVSGRGSVRYRYPTVDIKRISSALRSTRK